MIQFCSIIQQVDLLVKRMINGVQLIFGIFSHIFCVGLMSLTITSFRGGTVVGVIVTDGVIVKLVPALDCPYDERCEGGPPNPKQIHLRTIKTSSTQMQLINSNYSNTWCQCCAARQR